MRWAEIQVETTTQAQDAVTNVMIENGCGGTAVEGDAPVFVRCYLPVDDRLEERLERLQAQIKDLPKFGLDVGSGELTVKYAEDQNWADAWKQFFHTLRIGKRIVIKPSWEEYTPASRREVVIEIDPGMAFGTGNHATTKLCLEALEKYLKRRMTVVDFGTGSGILALAAAKMGARLVIAFDVDEVAVKAARENVQRNDIEEIIEVHQANNPRFVGMQVDLVTANLIAEIVMANAEDMAGLLRTGGILIASGIVAGKTLEVEQSLRNAGFDIAETRREEEWVAIIARKAG